MDDDTIEAEIRRLAALGGHKPAFVGPVPDEIVESAERELGVRFPRSYRAFLRRLGAAYMLHDEFYGLSVPPPPGEEAGPPYIGNVVERTKNDWDEGHGVPRNLILVNMDGGECSYYLDVSRRDDRDECPVVVSVSNEPPFVVADDFLEFVRKIAHQEPLF